MWSFLRIDPLVLLDKKKYVTFVGGGGKTSIAEYLAGLAIREGRRVAVTTTTKIWAREPYALFGRTASQKERQASFLRVGKSVEQGKLTGLTAGEVEDVGRDFDLVLIEGDGSKALPLKYPAPYEPVIPPLTDVTIVVAGLDALSGRVAEQVFRWELLSKASGAAGVDRVTPSLFLRLFEADGLLKGVDRQNALIILNKYDACRERQKVPELARAIGEHTGIGQVIVASVRHAIFYAAKEGLPGPLRT